MTPHQNYGFEFYSHFWVIGGIFECAALNNTYIHTCTS